VIIEGGSYSCGWWWAKHVKNAETNECVQIMEVEGLSGETVEEFFKQMHAASKGTHCTNYFEQWNINVPAHEHLTDEQWQEAHEIARKNHHLDGQPFFRIRHSKRDEQGNLRIHEHCFTSRIDLDAMKAIPDSLTAKIREQTSRELEEKYGLTPVKSVLVADREEPRPERRAKKWERFRGAESGIDPHDIDRELAAIKARCDNGRSFKAGAEAEGYVIVKGNRDFLVIDQAGDEHSLRRRLHMKAAELRAYMKDVDREALPTLEQGRARQLARAAEMEQRRAAIGRYDDIRPEQVAEAGQGQQQDSSPRAASFESAGARVTEPGAWDRDAADAAWMKAVDAEAIKAAQHAGIQPDYAAAKGRRDQIRPAETAREALQTQEAPPAPVEPAEAPRPASGPEQAAQARFDRDMENVAGDALETGERAATRILGGAVGWIAKLADALASIFSPPKPPTKEEVRQQQRAEAEEAPAREAARAAAESAAQYNDDHERRRRSARQLEEAQLARILGNTSPSEAQRGVDAERGRERELKREE
jgi:hypothetical protein